jgi:hypothetical protein
MGERPKSREETPKEGNDSSRYRIAINYTATHKNQDGKPALPCLLCMAEYQNQALFFGHAKLIALPILHRNRRHSDFQPVL